MNTSNPPEPPSSSVNLQSIRDLFQQASLQTTGKLAGLTVRSHFQPIFSVAHSRTVGFEGLMRPTDPSGHPISPLNALAMGRDFSHILTLDRLASAVHVHNFQQLKADGWLFLNMNTTVFLESVHDGHFLGELLEATGFPANRVVIEILEQGVLNDVRLGEAVQFFRKQGFLIALDDFGAGHSNFDRVWNLQPDIVKLDRSMTTQAASNLRIRRMMPVNHCLPTIKAARCSISFGSISARSPCPRFHSSGARSVPTSTPSAMPPA
jgi:EAL domain-containing protein (putative c-di-GMP-specific phosphodiesterase class I)